MDPTGITPTEAKKLGLHIHMTSEGYKYCAEYAMLDRLIDGHHGDNFSAHA
jgi:hypothetical protein